MSSTPFIKKHPSTKYKNVKRTTSHVKNNHTPKNYYAEPQKSAALEIISSNESISSPESGYDSLLPGIKPVLEILTEHPERVDSVFLRKGRHGKQMEEIVDLCRNHKIRFSLMEPPAFSKIYPGNSQGVIARLYESGFANPEELFDAIMDAPLPLIVALDQVQDPGNAGTLARTLYALGGAGMLVPRHNGVYLGAAAAKAGAGALAKLPVAKAPNLGMTLDQARKQGITIYGAMQMATEEHKGVAVKKLPIEQSAFEFTPRLPAILVLGGEEAGIRPSISTRCDVALSVPMLRSFDSLNVAQAGAILIAQFTKHILEKEKKS